MTKQEICELKRKVNNLNKRWKEQIKINHTLTEALKLIIEK